MTITVHQTSLDALQQLTWTFWVTDGYYGAGAPRTGLAVVLDAYTVSARATARHKFRATAKWMRLGGRRSAYRENAVVLESPPEVPDWVREDVVRQIAAGITFVVPEEKHTP